MSINYALTTAAVDDLHKSLGGRMDVSHSFIADSTINEGFLQKKLPQLKQMLGELIPNVFVLPTTTKQVMGEYCEGIPDIFPRRDDEKFSFGHWSNALRRFDGTVWAPPGKSESLLKFIQLCLVAGLAEHEYPMPGVLGDVAFYQPELVGATIAEVGNKELAERWLTVLREDDIYEVATKYFDFYRRQAGCSLAEVGTSVNELKEFKKANCVRELKLHVYWSREFPGQSRSGSRIRKLLAEGPVTAKDLKITQEELDNILLYSA